MALPVTSQVSIWQYPEILETPGIHLHCCMYNPQASGWVAAEWKTTQISETFYQRQNVQPAPHNVIAENVYRRLRTVQQLKPTQFHSHIGLFVIRTDTNVVNPDRQTEI